MVPVREIEPPGLPINLPIKNYLELALELTNYCLHTT
jgi:hypothetical protein